MVYNWDILGLQETMKMLYNSLKLLKLAHKQVARHNLMTGNESHNARVKLSDDNMLYFVLMVATSDRTKVFTDDYIRSQFLSTWSKEKYDNAKQVLIDRGLMIDNPST